MAGLVDTFARRNAVTAAAAPAMRTNSATKDFSATGDGGGGSWGGTPPDPTPRDDWTVYGPDGKPVPRSDWPNQNPDSKNTINQRNAERDAAQSFIDMYRNQLNEGLAGLNDSRAQQMINQQARESAYGSIQGAYKNQLAGQLENANLDIMGVGIQQSFMPQWNNFLSEQWGNAMTAGKADLDYVAKQQVNSANQRLIDWREIQQGRKEVDQQATIARRDATSAAVVGGIIQNAKQDYGDIDQERGNALYGLDLADQKSRLSEKQRREELSNRRAQLIGDLTAFDINTRESRAKLQEREQLLGIEAAKARLQPRMLMDQMNVTLQRLGLDRTMSTGQFLEAMANASAQERALLTQFNQDSWAAINGIMG
jgi:hypothetical protein